MKKIIFCTLLLSMISFTFYGQIKEKGIFTVQLGTGLGMPGLSAVDGGAYTSLPQYDFKIKPLYYTIAGTVRSASKKLEFGIEFGKATYKSDVTLSTRRYEWELGFTFFNLDVKYLLPLYLKKFEPYVKASLVNAIYTISSTETADVKNPNSFVDTESNTSYKLYYNLHIGSYYEITPHFNAYAELGLGFNLLKFGIAYKLFATPTSK